MPAIHIYANENHPQAGNPRRKGETNEEYTDRLAKTGSRQGKLRQCSIGWHEECSDPNGDTCTCGCHHGDDE